VRAALENIAIHEICGGVEELRQIDHVWRPCFAAA
jgi:hypothetical protein